MTAAPYPTDHASAIVSDSAGLAPMTSESRLRKKLRFRFRSPSAARAGPASARAHVRARCGLRSGGSAGRPPEIRGEGRKLVSVPFQPPGERAQGEAERSRGVGAVATVGGEGGEDVGREGHGDDSRHGASREGDTWHDGCNNDRA